MNYKSIMFSAFYIPFILIYNMLLVNIYKLKSEVKNEKGVKR